MKWTDTRGSYTTTPKNGTQLQPTFVNRYDLTKSLYTTMMVRSQPTPFIGRQADLAEIAKRLTDPACRLLTLVGPGGIGKSRCALEVARRTIDHYAQGAVFIDLAPLRQPDEINLALATKLHIPIQGRIDPVEPIVARLREDERLLVFDNFEHLLAGVGLLDRLLSECENITALVTSREVLRVEREWVWMVESLPYPVADNCDRVETFDAVKLFTARATQVSAGFDVTAECLCVVNIVRAVEGMPLGIELAASWLRILSCEEIVHEITRGLDILRSRKRDATPRHQSIRAVLDHSFELLEDHEQRVFQQLAVFRGGFTREAAHKIAGAQLSVLSTLVDKSLVRLGEDGKYSLHELIRQYAQERLSSSRDHERATRNRHASYYADFLAEREPHLAGAHREDFEVVEREIDNLRSAWAWTIEQHRITLLCKLIRPLVYFHNHRGWHNEIWHMVQQALSVARQMGDDLTLCRVLTDYSEAARLKKLFDEAESALQEALTLARRIGARHNEAEILRRLGNIYMAQGQNQACHAAFQECLIVGRDIEASLVVAEALFSLAFDAMRAGDYEGWDHNVSEALKLFRQLDVRWGVCATLWQVATSCFLVHHDYVCAQQMLDEAFDIYHQAVTSTPWLRSRLTGIAGFFASVQKRHDDARHYALEILAIAREAAAEVRLDAVHDAALITARIMADKDEAHRSAELLSFGTYHPWDYHRQLLVDPVIDRLRDALGSDEFDRAWMRGRQLNSDDVIRETTAWLTAGLSPSTRTSATPAALSDHEAPLVDPLTARELEVLIIMAAGLTNQEIADELVIAYSTVKKHINRIFSKLDVSHRAEAIARARELHMIE